METRHKNYNLILSFLVLAGVPLLIFFLTRNHNLQLLNPKGIIALKQRSILFTAITLMLIVVVPVVLMVFFFAWKYRAGRENIYTPNSENSWKTGILMWAYPTLVIVILATFMWSKTHELDPFKQINPAARPITIQVVALQWKWLFIYPDQNIATVNFVEFPKSTPINFQLTADAPMNSFWIPQLGGQMYAMTGMSTNLNLMASEIGEYAGSAAEISGAGFSGMKFVAKATTTDEFNAWVQSVKKSPGLTDNYYNQLATPSENNKVAYYSLSDKNLFKFVINKYMDPNMIATHSH